MTYSQTQWMILFYFYCVAGWIWETLYVSIRKKQWVNRGFLRGPWLPIYGTGAIAILFTTLPFSDNNFLVFIIGMVSATILEYITGAAMERIFRMRYWDYSEQPFNLNGHICLKVSTAWGFFSIFLIRILHPPVERLFFSLSGQVLDFLSIVLTMLFTADATRSIQEALDLKELLEKLTDNNELLKRLDDTFDALTEKLEDGSEQFKARIQELDATRVELIENAQEYCEEKVQSRKEYLLHRLTEQRTLKTAILSAVRDKTDAALTEIQEQLQHITSSRDHERLEKLMETLTEMQASIHSAEIDMAARKNRDFQRAVSILERNPSAKSKNYRQAFDELKNLKQDRRGEQ